MNIVVEQSSLPQMQLKRMEPNVYFSYETWFFHFYHGFFCAKISVYDSLHFETKNIATSFVFLLGKSGFPIGYAFFCIIIKKFYQRFFCGISAEIAAFRKIIAAVNLISQHKFNDNGASVVLRRLTAVSAELPAISEK